ncbi:WG repeat-containing protein [uncultured Bacteroides sp.]|uniref:WG repeat-containing protein n=1 Tax=uncultured Bacteroides sp. TaxID=162156 RepID=UPI002AABFDCE|nr:WG repeat-containing protein [uncultured Bacteroides sp.]
MKQLSCILILINLSITALTQNNVKYVIEPKFEDLWCVRKQFFHNGLGPVKIGGKWGYINKSGEFIIKPQFDHAYEFNDNGLASVDINGRCGYINKFGKLVIEPQFEVAINFDSTGYAEVQQNKKRGLINMSGKFILEPKYEDVDLFYKEKLIAVCEKGKWGYLDLNGRYVIKPQFERIDYDGFSKNGLTAVSLNGKYGIINKNGKFILKPQFKFASLFEENNLVLVEDIDGKWGYIDIDGNFIIKPQFDEMFFFKEDGLARVYKTGKAGCINERGEFIIEPQFEFLAFAPTNNHLAPAKKNGKWGYIDKSGKFVIELQFDVDFADGFAPNGLARVKTNGKWGFIDKSGQFVINPQFDEAYPFDINNLALVKVSGKWGQIKKYLLNDQIKEYVTDKINQWQQKGEFEKIADYQKRVNTQARNQKIEAYTQEAVEKLKSEFKKAIVTSEFELKEYDADNETFLIHSKSLNNFSIKVPISEASAFKQNWTNMQFSGYDFYIDNNKFQLGKLTATNPVNHKDYSYDCKQVTTYVANNITYNFDPIEVDVAQNVNGKNNSKIESKNIELGKSDIDINIPVNKATNDKTFAIIIANENYQREGQVIFARNDGDTFRKYCLQTLGLPEKNVHFVENATLNNFRGEINWLSSVADAYKGEANIIFYYAGHGIPDESSKSAYLLPVDGYGSDVTTGYKLDDLYAKLGALQVKNITLFMDACFSGSQRSGQMLASARGVAIRIKQDVPQGNMVVFSAAKGDETAYPYKEKGHGLFTYFLLKKLQETKGAVTLGELSSYITANVSQQSIVVNSKSQTPTVVPSANVENEWRNFKIK